MDAYEQETNELLKEHGAVLKRRKKHEIWRLPNGQTFVRSTTPSDRKSGLANLTELRRLLGVNDPARGQPGERREHPPKPGAGERPIRLRPTLDTALANQLRLAGCVEDRLRDEIDQLKAALRGAEAERARLVTETQSCWWCRLRRWWQNRRTR